MFETLESYLAGFVEPERAAIRIATDRERIVQSPQREIGYTEYAMWAAGATRQAERIAHVAQLATKAKGDFVEIGAWLGDTTLVLAALARKMHRKVITIDPYITGTQNCGGIEYPFFLERIKPFSDVVTHWRESSQTPEIKARLAKRKIAFAFVDGLHTYQGAFEDLNAVAHASIIAIDDLFMAPVVAAYEDFAEGHKETLDAIAPKFLREAYFVRKQNGY